MVSPLRESVAGWFPVIDTGPPQPPWRSGAATSGATASGAEARRARLLERVARQ